LAESWASPIDDIVNERASERNGPVTDTQRRARYSLVSPQRIHKLYAGADNSVPSFAFAYSSLSNAALRSAAHLSAAYTPATHPPDLLHLLDNTVRSLQHEEVRISAVSAKRMSFLLRSLTVRSRIAR
jgi:hypothetical protein